MEKAGTMKLSQEDKGEGRKPHRNYGQGLQVVRSWSDCPQIKFPTLTASSGEAVQGPHAGTRHLPYSFTHSPFTKVACPWAGHAGTQRQVRPFLDRKELTVKAGEAHSETSSDNSGWSGLNRAKVVPNGSEEWLQKASRGKGHLTCILEDE